MPIEQFNACVNLVKNWWSSAGWIWKMYWGTKMSFQI